MNKIIKTLCIGFIISLSVFIGDIDEVRAADEGNSGECNLFQKLEFTCSYASKDNEYKAEVRVYYKEGKHDLNVCPDIYVSKYDNDLIANHYHGDENKESIRRLALTAQCPQAMALYKNGASWGSRTGTDTEINDYINKNPDYKKLYLIDDTKTQVSNIAKTNELHTRADLNYHISYGYNVYSTEAKYWCDYTDKNDSSNHWKLYFTESFHRLLEIDKAFNKHIYSSPGEKNDSGNIVNKGWNCPNKVYKITNISNGSVAYSYFGDYVGSGWPVICKEKDIKCEVITSIGEYQQYGVTIEKKDIPIEGTYYLWKGLFKDLDKQHSINADITINGDPVGGYQPVKFSLKKDGKEVGIATDGVLNKDSFFNSLGTSLLSTYLGCWKKEEAVKAGYTLLYDTSKDYEYYCYPYWADDQGLVNGFTPQIGDEIFRLSGAIVVDDIGVGTINSFNKNFGKLCSICKSSNSSECDGFIGMYDLAKKYLVDCKEIYGGLNINDVSMCDTFMNNLETWSKDGCFGNRVITGDTNYGCDTLGPGLSMWLSRIYTIFKFAVPIIIIAMGIKDFIQALSAGKEDEFKKMGSTFVKRLIMGAVFVALPILIEMILTIALGGSFADMCITI